MEFTSPRATFDEVLEFANAVRAAGGGAVLDALMPATPDDAHQCLIAKNLNFNCRVDGDVSSGHWNMYFEDDVTLRDRIADALGLEKGDDRDEYDTVYDYYVKLPAEIGQVAADFDSAGSIVGQMLMDVDEVIDNPGSDYDEGELELAKEMLPYILESVDEAKRLGIFNEKGELVL